jgi:hypothetical protein
VNNSGTMALNDGFDHLAEKILGHRFRKSTSFRDKVKQIFARFHPFHNDDEDIARITSIQQLDDAIAL